MSKKNLKKEQADNPNRIRSLYLANTIFLCCLTLVSLAFALFVFFRLRTRGTDGYRQLYSDSQIESIKESAAAEERNALLLQIQSSLESGRSTTRMLREIFSDSIVVVSGGRYYFYPLADGVDPNVIEPGALYQDGEGVAYAGGLSGVSLEEGILVSEDNGRVDWDRLADSGIKEVTVTAGTITENGFRPDQELERNCLKAQEKGLRLSLCLEIRDPADRETVSEAVEALTARGLLQAGTGAERQEEETAGDKEEPAGDKEEPGGGAPGDGEAEPDPDSAGAGEQEPGGDPAPDAGEKAGGGPAQPGAAEENAGAEASETADAGTGPEAGSQVVLRLREAEELSDDGGDKREWTETVRMLCDRIEEAGGAPVIGGGLFSFAAQIDLQKLSAFDRWVIDHEEAVSFPYRFSFWEYSAEGHKEGVPGTCMLYVRAAAPRPVSVETGQAP